MHWLRLLRLPNVLTALADICAGYLLVSTSLQPWPVFGCLALASMAIYLGGIVLNDVNDFDQDLKERPRRPLPAGQVGRQAAARLAAGLLVVGFTFGWLPWLAQLPAATWRMPAVATFLTLAVVAYDLKLKATWAGPLAMGTCRAANWIFGMSCGPVCTTVPTLFGLDASQWLIVGGYGCFIAGVTWFARTEASHSGRRQLVWGAIWMISGWTLMGLFPFRGAFTTHERTLTLATTAIWPLLLMLLGFPIFRRSVSTIANPTPAAVQRTVRLAIQSTIVLNAAICLAVRSPIWWAVGILALLIPMYTLGRWIDST